MPIHYSILIQTSIYRPNPKRKLDAEKVFFPGRKADFSAKKVPFQRLYFLLEFGLWTKCCALILNERLPDFYTVFSWKIP